MKDRGDREYTVITFVLATALGVIVLVAVGYGIFNSSRGNTAVPLGNQPVSTTGAR